MLIRKLLGLVLLCAVASFGQEADTSKQNSQKKATAENVIVQQDSNHKTLSKQLIIRKNPTTWTKLKDMFM